MPLLFIVMKKKNLLVTDESVINYFKNKGTSLITYEVAKNNPHYHIVLETTYKIDAIRNSITRIFDLPKGYKSVKHVENKEKSLIYILKEQCVKHNDLVTEEQLKAYQILSETITLEKQSNPTKKFLENFDTEYFDSIKDINDKHLYIQQHIQNFFETNVVNINYQSYEKYYNRALAEKWPTEFLKLLASYECRHNNYLAN